MGAAAGYDFKWKSLWEKMRSSLVTKNLLYYPRIKLTCKPFSFI